MLETLHWLGHDAFRIDGPPVVYLDPYRLAGELPPADLVLITHDHFDHLSAEDVAKVRVPRTIVAGPPEVAARLGGVEVLHAGDERTLAGVSVRAVPAYNTNKKFHPKKSGKVGFVLTVGGVTYYHAGDTDLIPEMEGLRPDVALLPVSGTYVMTAAEAAEAARRIAPRTVVPMHWGTIVGSEADARELARLLDGSGIAVVIKPKE
ncbi:MAG TPA: MBL fold metallo-hydrolase [Thermoanaerobaculaceae bacterium]|nr:MBL fold metallo-hydrolase [Thermoanaerobaculaceae bacterium]HRS14643.1 MBL fold metallo-hydrolase [Thermoanaerobaculaceae bacterium]